MYELQGRYGGSLADLRLGILQTIAVRQPINNKQSQLFFDERPETTQVINDFAEQDLIEFDVDETPEDHEPVFILTQVGYEALERWDFEFGVEDSEPPEEP